MIDRVYLERPRSFCAMGGALLTATALPGVVPILHAAPGCAGSVYFNQLGSTGYLGAGYCGGLAVPSSNVGEHDIVFGGDDRLTEQIENTLRLVDGDLYVVITGCTTDIIGDDVRSIVGRFAAEDAPIVAAETGGFKGDARVGYELLLSELFARYIRPSAETIPGKVNLIGVVPGQNAFWRGDLTHLRRLLEKLGLEVSSLFLEDDSLESLKDAGGAELTIVASEFYGTRAARVLEEEQGVPYVALPFPIGPTATSRFLTGVAEALGTSADAAVEVLHDEEARYFRYIERIADAINDLDLQRYAVVVGDADSAPALTEFLADDLGWLPELTVVTDDLDEERRPLVERRLASLGSGYETKLVYETDATAIPEHLARHWPRSRGQRFYDSFSPAFVIGSHLEREFAKDIKAGHLSVSFPVGNRVVLDRGYAGFAGSLTLVEDLLSVLVAER